MNSLRTYIIIIIFIAFYQGFIYSQDVFYHLDNQPVYKFLDEMATEGFIELNTVVKPYSRTFIAEKLKEISERSLEKENGVTNQRILSTRQSAELEFYLKDFGKEIYKNKNFKKRKDLFYYKDSLLTFSVNPILGIQYWRNNRGSAFHRWNGLGGFVYLGDHWAACASIRDNHESVELAQPLYLTSYRAGPYKNTGDGSDYVDVRGGITYSWNWGHVGLVKDHMEWGSNYHGPNILSSKAPSFALFKIQLRPVKWFEFNYIHGWLVSELVDSSRSYSYANVRRDVYHDKYYAANFFTFTPLEKTSISFGNAVVYSDVGLHPGYFLPVLFYKASDLTYNGVTNSAGQNSMMFFDLSTRMIRKMHLYSSWFIDVLSINDIFKEDIHANHWSIKGGMHLSNIIPNIFLTFEYTRTNPLCYKNDLITTFYESNHYNMGHFLRDNADEIYLNLQYKPFKNLSVQFEYIDQRKGPDYIYARHSQDPNTRILGVPFMEEEIWKNRVVKSRIRYQPINDGYLFVEFIKSNMNGAEGYAPEIFYGNNVTINLGTNFGF